MRPLGEDGVAWKTDGGGGVGYEEVLQILSILIWRCRRTPRPLPNSLCRLGNFYREAQGREAGRATQAQTRKSSALRRFPVNERQRDLATR